MVVIAPPLLVNGSTPYVPFLAFGGPFYFAWVDPDETTFGPEHLRMDEHIFSARRMLVEGEKPKLELVIENPRVGLLSALRKQWCWFSWFNGSEVMPLFFGRVVGVPSDIQAETITVNFIAWPNDYVKQSQKLAETLKTPPHYDPVFTDVSKRDDPLSIFEAHSKMICVDPVTHVVSASDILDAEDGNVGFTEEDHFYGSLKVSPGALPKTVIHFDATVQWTQTAHGYLNLQTPSRIVSYSGDGIVNDWPKPQSNIAPGITMFAGGAFDTAGIDMIQMVTISSSYQNKAKKHIDGSVLTANSTVTFPSAAGIRGVDSGNGVSAYITFQSQTGLLDPYAVDDGDPAPINIPASNNFTTAFAFPYLVATALVVEYRAERPHSERIIFRLSADVQPTVLDPLVSEDTETITISGSDVGVPIIDLLNWTTVSGTFVDVGTVIFPDDPQLPGGRTAQVCVNDGTAGDESPDFSDVVGELTFDGSVTWASLGTATPTESAVNWTGVTNVPTGTMILPQRPIYCAYETFVLSGKMKFPPTGTPVTKGLVVQSSNGAFQVCTQGGETARFGTPSFGSTWGALTTDGTAVWTCLGTTLPSGTTYFVATEGGLTGDQYVIPPFDETEFATTADGTVVWTSVGTGDIPAGGTPGNVHASSYYHTDRGRRSIEHLICRARARLRYASRAVNTTFACTFLRGTQLTLRKSVTLEDHRLPGGVIAGKVTSTTLIASGGSFTCDVGIGSAVGKATTIEEVEGDPIYVDDDYVEDEYQVHDGTVVLLPVLSDVGYTPIVPTPDGDGISFPLEKSMIVVNEAVYSSGDQAEAIASAFASMKAAAIELARPKTSVAEIVAAQLSAALLSSNSVGQVLTENPVWYELELKPLNGNGDFNKVYHMKCTNLALPMHINLEEESES